MSHHAMPAPAQSNAEVPPCLSVVMPLYNEERSLAAILDLVLAQRPVRELIVVDDASTDGSWRILQEAAAADTRIKPLRHEVNRGKGAALASGFARASADFVLVQDADLEYDPTEYHKLLQPLLDGRADVVFGTRFGSAGPRRVLYFWHAVGNKLLTTLSNMFTNLNLTDMETCYKAFRREALAGITIREPRFGFEPEITAKVARNKLRVYEVPISYYGRTYAEGKKVNWRDGVSALRCIVKYSLFR